MRWACRPRRDRVSVVTFRPDDVVMGENGALFLVEADRYSGRVHFVPFMAIAAEQHFPPSGATLLCRTVDGRRLPVLDIDGEMYAVQKPDAS